VIGGCSYLANDYYKNKAEVNSPDQTLDLAGRGYF
jgi:hypothetical protein